MIDCAPVDGWVHIEQFGWPLIGRFAPAVWDLVTVFMEPGGREPVERSAVSRGAVEAFELPVRLRQVGRLYTWKQFALGFAQRGKNCADPLSRGLHPSVMSRAATISITAYERAEARPSGVNPRNHTLQRRRSLLNPAISIQLWTVRDELAADLDATLARLKSVGFDRVEAFGFVDRVDELAEAFARHGITASTGHASLASSVENPFDSSITAPTNADVFAAARKLGMSVVIDPFVAPDRWQTLEEITKTAQLLNAAASAAADHGIKVGYHNHDHELMSRIGGRFALEVFANLLDPRVLLEVDLYWAAAGGADVTGLLERLGERVVAVHVKDGTLNPIPTTGAIPTDQVPAGYGVVPLMEALDAAQSLQYAIVEFDDYSDDIWSGVTASYEFLAARGLS